MSLKSVLEFSNKSSKDNKPVICPACKGLGLQTRNDGIQVICPVCGGSGMWYRPKSSPSTPKPLTPIPWTPKPIDPIGKPKPFRPHTIIAYGCPESLKGIPDPTPTKWEYNSSISDTDLEQKKEDK